MPIVETGASASTRGMTGRSVPGAIAVALLAFALYWPAARNAFVEYDDDLYVTENGHVKQGLTWSNVAWAFTTTDASNWHPVTWLSYMVDAELFGIQSRAFHLSSIAVHALNAALLFWLLLRTTGSALPSLVVTALFAVHPLNVQSVAWIAERKNLLSTLFWLLAMLAYSSWVKRQTVVAYAAVVAGLSLSLMAKPMAVTLPFVLLLFDYWPLDRWRLGWRRLALEKLPLVAIVAAFSLVTYRVQAASGAVIDAGAIPMSVRFGNAVWSYLAYLAKAIRPAGLSAFYPYAQPPLPVWQVIAAALFLAVVTIGIVVYRERLRPVAVGWLWYLGTLVPVIGLVQVGSQAMADRYAYVPLIGVFVMIAWSGLLLVRQGALPRIVAGGAALGLVATLSMRTMTEIPVWRDTTTLFEHTIRVEPRAWVAHYNLGNAYDRTGRHKEAAARFRDAIRWAPDFARAHNGLGSALAALGRNDEAIASYERAIALKPDLVEAHNNLGIALAGRGRVNEGMDHLRTALQLRPDFAEARLNLVIALRQSERLDESIAEADRLLAGLPDYSEARYQRALALARAGNLAGVRADLDVLDRTAPDLAARLRSALDAAVGGRR